MVSVRGTISEEVLKEGREGETDSGSSELRIIHDGDVERLSESRSLHHGYV